MRVLVCDDDRESAEALAALLGSAAPVPLTVDVSFDGRRAVELAIEARPDVAILDLEMPALNGFAAAVEIRQALGNAAPVLIAISGASRHVTAADAGGVFDYALRKPIDFVALSRLVFRSKQDSRGR